MIVLCIGFRVEAQNAQLSVAGSPNPVVVSNFLTLTIHVTNTTGVVVQNIVVTNIPNPLVGFVSASGVYTFGPGSNSISLNTGPLAIGAGTNLTMVIAPLVAGIQTNFFSATTTNFPASITSTNLLSNVVPAQSNLVVQFADFPPLVFSNDWVTYRLVVTNSSALQNLALTNVLPAGVKFISASPAAQSPIVSNRLVFSINASTNATSFQVTVQPTNTGVLTFSAFVTAAGLFDTNNPNQTATTNLTVNAFSGTLIATNVSTMQFDPQTGLMDQKIRLSNIGTNDVASARVIVSGLTNRLFNAVGTNNGKPFVVYGNTLSAGASVDLILELFIKTRVPITISNSQYTAVGIDAVNLSAANGTNGTFQITKIVPLTNSYVLIEFQSVTNGIYTILYSDDNVNWLQAQPNVMAHGNRTQWIDTGPPKTISLPSTRFYRAIQNP